MIQAGKRKKEFADPYTCLLYTSLLQSGTTDNSKATRYVNRVTNLKNLEASNAFFAELVREIHARGMKVILDGVFNHCGSFNKWLDLSLIHI